MSVDRIFAELNSRQFKFVVDGQAFELPHLNTMKVALRDVHAMAGDSKRFSDIKAIFFLFDAAGNARWSARMREMSFGDVKKIYEAWFEWSGFTLGKSSGRGRR